MEIFTTTHAITEAGLIIFIVASKGCVLRLINASLSRDPGKCICLLLMLELTRNPDMLHCIIICDVEPVIKIISYDMYALASTSIFAIICLELIVN